MKYTRTLFIGLLSLTVACHNDINPYLKKNIDWWESSVDYFLLPVTFVNADKSNDSSIKDTLYHLVIPPSIILHRINMQLCMNFQDVLYNTLIYDDNKIYVDSTLFNKYYPYRVIEDKTIYALYTKEGIVGVLNKYLDNDGWLEKYLPIDRYQIDTINRNTDTVKFLENPIYQWHGKGVNIEYIVHLASLHNIYFWKYDHLPDEYVGTFITLTGSDPEQLKGLKVK